MNKRIAYALMLLAGTVHASLFEEMDERIGTAGDAANEYMARPCKNTGQKLSEALVFAKDSVITKRAEDSEMCVHSGWSFYYFGLALLANEPSVPRLLTMDAESRAFGHHQKMILLLAKGTDMSPAEET